MLRLIHRSSRACSGRDMREQTDRWTGCGWRLAQLVVTTADAGVSLLVFVILASRTIAGPAAYYLLSSETAKARLEEMKD
jgi:hypothetical protein